MWGKKIDLASNNKKIISPYFILYHEIMTTHSLKGNNRFVGGKRYYWLQMLPSYIKLVQPII